MTLCQHCAYVPARADCGGYCSWDCHDNAYAAPDDPTAPTIAAAAARAPNAGIEAAVAAAAGAA